MSLNRRRHMSLNGTHIWSNTQDSWQQIVLFAQADGSNEFNYFQPGSLNTTNHIIGDVENIDMVVHTGHNCHANLSQWSQFTFRLNQSH